MIGATIRHYQIVRKLGAGGMGEVYLALDTKLDRQVAVKILPDSISAEPDARARLLREAQASSRLKHPNIVTVYSVEEHDGRDFMVMEYVEGVSLFEYLRSGLSLRAILSVMVQVAKGLDHAHRAGVVHRDLKPANVIVDGEGRPRILDFGIAKMRGAAKLTKTGTTLGTVAYCSPEQVCGEEVDDRSDIFSFGVMLYEVLTGQLPFVGEHEAAVIYAIMSEEPASASSVTPDLPVALDRVITRCLSKKPSDRFQTVSELLTELAPLAGLEFTTAPDSRLRSQKPPSPGRRWPKYAAAAVGVVLIALVVWLVPARWLHKSADSGRLMLAVLPFESEGAPDKEYFADGITEEITARLARVSGLGVIARSSARKYKNTDKSAHQIAAELGVDYLLMGTIRWQDNKDGLARVRVTPELVRVTDETNIWAEPYDRPLTEVFQVQSDIAQNVVRTLNVTLLEPEQSQLAAKPTDNLEAYDDYLRGIDYMSRNSDWHQTSDLSIPMFERAIALDSNFVAAHAKLAQMLIELFWHTDRKEEYIIRARETLDRALAMDSTNPEVYVSLGSFYYHRGEYNRGLEAFARAQQYSPNNTDALTESGYAYRRSGRFREAAAALEKVVELDPRAHMAWLELGRTYRYMRRYATADSIYVRVQSLVPEWLPLYDEQFWSAMDRWDFDLARNALEEGAKFVRPASNLSTLWAWWYMFKSDYAQARERMSPDIADSVYYYYLRAWALRQEQNPQASIAAADSARVIAETSLESLPDNPWLHQNLGLAYAFLGRKEDAIREVRRAVDLIPYSSDTQNSLGGLEALSIIYGLVGEPDQSCSILDTLLSNPSQLSRKIVGMSFEWSQLHGQPRFEALVKEKESVL